MPRIDGGRCRLGVDDGIQEGDVRVIGEGVEGDTVDSGQRKGVQSSQVEKPVATNNTENLVYLFLFISIIIFIIFM